MDNPKMDRYLKDKAMDHIDHALGRPFDPTGETYRNYFAIDTGSDLAAQFRASPNWREGRACDDMAYFFVTDEGRAALAAHLKEIGDKNRMFAVTFDGEACSPVIAESHGKARYQAFLNISDCWDISFREFCKQVSVRLAVRHG